MIAKNVRNDPVNSLAIQPENGRGSRLQLLHHGDGQRRIEIKGSVQLEEIWCVKNWEENPQGRI